MFDLNSNILTAQMVRLQEECERAGLHRRPSRSPRPDRPRWRGRLSRMLHRWATGLEAREGGVETVGGE